MDSPGLCLSTQNRRGAVGPPLTLFRLFRLAAEALGYPVPLGLCGHGPTDKRRDRLSGLLSGLLGHRQRFRGKDSPTASVRFCELLSGLVNLRSAP